MSDYILGILFIVVVIVIRVVSVLLRNTRIIFHKKLK